MDEIFSVRIDFKRFDDFTLSHKDETKVSTLFEIAKSVYVKFVIDSALGFSSF